MRLLIVDDHAVVRQGVRSLILERKAYQVCGEAADGQEAVEKARELKPDLIVMDVSMPKLNGLEATRQVRGILPDCEILIMSQHDSSEMVRERCRSRRAYHRRPTRLPERVPRVFPPDIHQRR